MGELHCRDEPEPSCALLVTSGNCLTALPDSITRLSELQFLSVNSNQLAELPDDIGRLEKCVLQRRGNGVVARCGGGVAD